MIIGKELSQLETPALWVDLDIMGQNIRYLADYFHLAKVAWRPHTKGIKVPAIAHQLLSAGVIGITCAKLSEAEVMVAAGVRDILIANQIVGPMKVARLVNLRRHADVMVAVDNLENAQEISQAAVEKGVIVRVLLEVNIGMDRCGVAPGRSAVDLAHKINSLAGLHFTGVMGYEGHLMGIEDFENKKQCVEEAIGRLILTANLIRESGLGVPIVSCGGTGDYMIAAHIPGVTEIQAGGAIFSDVLYQKWGVETRPSLFVLATVVSRPSPYRAVVDAGRKAMNSEAAMPQVVGIDGAQLISTHAEHGLLDLRGIDVPLKVGDRINFIVGYGDNTVHLHDRLYGIRNEKVEIVWEIQGRGKLS